MASVDVERSHVQSSSKGSRTAVKGLRVDPCFVQPEVADPLETVEWELRSAAIKDESGGVLFEQRNCEIPKDWSQLATNVVVSKYFYGENGTPQRERSVRQLVHRVARTIADWGTADGYFASPDDGERFYRELAWLCVHQHGSFNSPVWFNVGLHHQYGVTGDRCNWRWDPKSCQAIHTDNPYEYPQASACFIQSVGDNMEDIMSLATSEAMLFKFGSGTGHRLVDDSFASREALGWRSAFGSVVVHAGVRPDRGGGQVGRQDASRGQDAIAQGLASGHPGVHRMQVEGREEGSRADRKRWVRSQFQR